MSAPAPGYLHVYDNYFQSPASLMVATPIYVKSLNIFFSRTNSHVFLQHVKVKVFQFYISDDLDLFYGKVKFCGICI